MHKEFWLERWEQNQIAFHQGQVHPMLIKHASNFADLDGKIIFVPLCGKSLDMIWLQGAGAKVIGCELSHTACEDFFIENKLSYTTQNLGDLTVYSSENITIYCGDFFHLDNQVLKSVNYVYDRAALVALPLEMRKKYVTHLKLILPQVVYLLIAFSYTSEVEIGPPFAVFDDEISLLYSESYSIRKLEQTTENVSMNSRLYELGVLDITESSYLLISR